MVLELCSFVIKKMNSNKYDKLAHFLAYLSFNVLRVRRKIVETNLNIVYNNTKTDKEKRTIAYRCYYNFFLTGIECLAKPNGDISETVVVEGQEHMQHAKNGAYLLCLHMGNWEAMVSKFPELGYTINGVVKKVGSNSINNYVSKMRIKNGTIPTERGGKKGDTFEKIKNQILRHELAGFFLDHSRPGAPKLPFFGKPAKTNTSLAALVKKVPAPVIPIYIVREGVAKHRLTILAPVELKDTDNYKKDVLENTLKFNEVFEGIIKKCPEQYFWLHNRWKQ